MKLQDIRPSLYRISYFKYTHGEHTYAKIALEKSQYVYRILLIDRGMLDIIVGGRCERITAGDAVYLLPGEIYRLQPVGEDFSLYNLFFDVRDDVFTPEDKHRSCIFMDRYDASLCFPRVEFEDAPVLNRSGILKNVTANRILRSLLYKDPSDALYSFYGRAALLSVITDLLLATQETEKKHATVQQILAYIRHNPESDLSGEALSRVFSYHKNHINKLIKQETGRSLHAYARSIKIEYAKMLLSEGCNSLTALSLQLGYYDYSHFYRAFLQETGITPTEYVKAL